MKNPLAGRESGVGKISDFASFLSSFHAVGRRDASHETTKLAHGWRRKIGAVFRVTAHSSRNIACHEMTLLGEGEGGGPGAQGRGIFSQVKSPTSVDAYEGTCIRGQLRD